MADEPVDDDNPYCTCGKHQGRPFHETNDCPDNEEVKG